MKLNKFCKLLERTEHIELYDDSLIYSGKVCDIPAFCLNGTVEIVNNNRRGVEISMGFECPCDTCLNSIICHADFNEVECVKPPYKHNKKCVVMGCKDYQKRKYYR